MVYTFKKPDGGPSPLLDAPNIQGNFSTYGTVFGNNHIAMNGNNQGDHTTIIFETQTADPGVSSNIDNLYSKDVVMRIGTQPEVFLQIPMFLPKTPDWTQNLNRGMQLTYSTVDLIGPQYQSFLFGGYIIFFGIVTGNTSTSVTVSSVVTLTNPPTNLLDVIVQTNTVSPDASTTPLDQATNIDSNSQFTIRTIKQTASYAFTYRWVAIGTV